MIRCRPWSNTGYGPAGKRGLWLIGMVGLLGVGCQGGGDDDDTYSPTPDPTPAGPHLDGPLPYETLSEYHFFRGDMRRLEPTTGVVPYEVNSPLFSDHASKDRFIVLPDGEQIQFSEDGRWTFPEGTILIKNFAFEDDLSEVNGTTTQIETRLLMLKDGVWTPFTYLWNEDQTEAHRLVVGAFLTVEYADEEGQPVSQRYEVPNTNQCKNCHSSSDEVIPIGVRTRQLNRVVDGMSGSINQLEHFQHLGLFESAFSTVSLPALAAPEGGDSLEMRARSYLEANCSHCHQRGGAAGASGLVLTTDEADPYYYGVCHRPAAAGTGSGGLEFDIVPRKPDESIIVYRMSSLDPEIRMPELGSLVLDEEGLELIRAWIENMDPAEYPDCEP